MSDVIGSAIVEIEADTSPLDDGIIEAVQKAADEAQDLLSSAFNSTISDVGDSFQELGDTGFDGLASGVDAAAQLVTDGFESAATQSDTALQDIGSGAADAVESRFAGAGDVIVEEFVSAADQADNALSSIGEGAADAIESQFEGVGDNIAAQFDQVGESAQGAGEAGGEAGAAIGGAMGAATAKIGGAVGAIAGLFEIQHATELAENFDQAIAITTQLLENQGKQAQFTADQLVSLAKSISAATGDSALDIIKAENRLLAVGNLSEDIFTRGLNLATDFARVMGTNVTGAARLFARALQDPTKAAGILRRAMIVLTDAQKDHIQALIDSGHKEEAQAFILDLLEKKMGGVAASSSKMTDKLALAAKAIERQFGDAIAKFLDEHGQQFLDFFSKLAPLAKDIGKAVGSGLAAVLPPVLTGLGKLIDLFLKLPDPVKKAAIDVAALALALRAASLVPGIPSLRLFGDKGIATGLVNTLRAAGGNAEIAGAAGSIGTTISTALTGAVSGPAIAVVLGTALGFGIHAAVEKFAPGVDTALEGFGGAIYDFFAAIPAKVLPALEGFGGAIFDFFANLPSTIGGALGSFGGAIFDGLATVFGGIATFITQTVPQFFLGIPAAIGNFFASIDWAQVGAAIVTPLLVVFFGIPKLLVTAIVTWGPTILSAIATGFTAVIGFFAALPGRIVGFLSAAGHAIVSIFTTAMHAMATAVSTGIAAVISFFAALPGRVAGAIRAIISTVVGIARSAMSGMAHAVSAGVTAVIGFFKELPGKMADALAAMVTKATEIGGNVIHALASAISRGASAIKDALLSVAKGAWDAVLSFFHLHSPSLLAMDAGANIVIGLEQGILSRKASLEELMARTAEDAWWAMEKVLASKPDAWAIIAQRRRDAAAGLSSGVIRVHGGDGGSSGGTFTGDNTSSTTQTGSGTSGDVVDGQVIIQGGLHVHSNTADPQELAMKTTNIIGRRMRRR